MTKAIPFDVNEEGHLVLHDIGGLIIAIGRLVLVNSKDLKFAGPNGACILCWGSGEKFIHYTQGSTVSNTCVCVNTCVRGIV